MDQFIVTAEAALELSRNIGKLAAALELGKDIAKLARDQKGLSPVHLVGFYAQRTYRRACKIDLDTIPDGLLANAVLHLREKVGAILGRLESRGLYPPTKADADFIRAKADDILLVAGNAGPTPPAVDEEDIAILQVLKKYSPRLMTAQKIAGHAHVSEKTVGARLHQLTAKKLASRPLGKNRGATITQEGKAILENLPAAS
jgi:hypothetical protein